MNNGIVIMYKNSKLRQTILGSGALSGLINAGSRIILNNFGGDCSYFYPLLSFLPLQGKANICHKISTILLFSLILTSNILPESALNPNSVFFLTDFILIRLLCLLMRSCTYSGTPCCRSLWILCRISGKSDIFSILNQYSYNSISSRHYIFKTSSFKSINAIFIAGDGKNQR